MKLPTLASPLSHTFISANSLVLSDQINSNKNVKVETKHFSRNSLLAHTSKSRTKKYQLFSQINSVSNEPDDISEGVDEDEIINVGVSDVEELVEIPDLSPEPTLESSIPLPPSDAPSSEFSEVEELKQALFDSLYGTDRGFRASSETRGEIAELISQLEALNPNPETTESLPLLEGKWVLTYTSFSELFPLLAAGSLPLVSVGEISQSIDISSTSVKNAVTFSGPLGSSTFTTNASYEVRSSKRLQVKFEEGVFEPPQITSSIQLPDSLEVAGQKIELQPFQGVIRPLEEAASAIARIISGQPPIKFPFPSPQAQSWLLTTFLDKDLRVSRGDGGSLFILTKEGSSYN